MAERLISMLIVSGELLALLAAATGFLVWRITRRRNHDRAAARALVEKVKASESERLAQLKQTLKETYHLDEAAAAEHAGSLWNLEKNLYSRFLRSFLGQDPEPLESLEDSVQSLVKGYRDLVPADNGQADAPSSEHSADTEALQEQLHSLKGDNERLRSELEETNHAMDQMVREYVSMYGGSHEEAMKKLGRPPKAGEAAAQGEEQGQ